MSYGYSQTSLNINSKGQTGRDELQELLIVKEVITSLFSGRASEELSQICGKRGAPKSLRVPYHTAGPQFLWAEVARVGSGKAEDRGADKCRLAVGWEGEKKAGKGWYRGFQKRET